ncbi:sensor histidine kinase [Kineothrix sp. MB12-C1]|uniref:sensor histidine kinase n=1 Tax=Kineothrix sp. MB12-C1 TaxID=3070215 RepID=UPI0027D2B14C|nr:histidine kinase [Kineothrix sp. MB12-C1]WMC94304.1 histidine kinase [Kineothrix sp. MB12-C1]
MKNKSLAVRFSKFRNSVTGKYSLGYLLLGVIAVVLLVISFMSNYSVSMKYKNTTDRLLVLNELYVNIETINSSVNSSYLYLRTNNYEEYIEECKAAESTIEKNNDYLNREYAREIIDTIHTAETYIEQTDSLMSRLKAYVESPQKEATEYRELEQLYGETQKTLGFMNLSFQSAYAHQLISVKKTQKEIQEWQQWLEVMQITLLILGGMLCFLYCIRIIKGITHSIKKLTAVVKKIEDDVYEESHVEMDSKDEFEDFGKAFNHMIDVIQAQLRKIEENASIKERLAEVEIEKLRIYGELQKSQLTLLQSRINPHFLFNTLNMISSLAKIENADRSAELMEITAAYLRYNLDNLSKSVTLSQEIDNLKNYVCIQKSRFEERYSYYFDIEEACEDFPMPFMILQPLVENSIKHGLAMKITGGEIRVRVYKREEFLVVEVEDNGVGMSPEKIQEIMLSLEDYATQSEHIGLSNIYRRLQYFYEEEVEIQIISNQQQTLVRILLPFGEEEKNAYDDNSR